MHIRGLSKAVILLGLGSLILAGTAPVFQSAYGQGQALPEANTHTTVPENTPPEKDGTEQTGTEQTVSVRSAPELYRRGFTLQQQFRTREALDMYRQALAADPGYGLAHYEIGWSYWVLEDWKNVVSHWEKALELKAGPPELADFLQLARDRKESKPQPLVRSSIGAEKQGALSDGTTIRMRLKARFQNYKAAEPEQGDILDKAVFSPKSVSFLPDGSKAYVQALEGHATLVYSPTEMRRTRVISHIFDSGTGSLFEPEETEQFRPRFTSNGMTGDFNSYKGKPVESVFSHDGRFLWVSHYRRDFDRNGVMPSSVALIDTASDRIIRVMQTGPIPKFLAVSPDSSLLAVVHWGDNTVGLIDISTGEPASFRHSGEITVERQLNVNPGRKVNRDRMCGFCLRGTVFTADGKYLLVSRMGGGGIAVLDVARRKYMGTVRGMRPTPRHLVLSSDGELLYVGSNSSGYISVYNTADLIRAALAGTRDLKPLREARSGQGTRTIALSPDGKIIYGAVNNKSLLVAHDAVSLKKLFELPADSYPVGLAVSPDGTQVWLTSQGRKLRGGNSVMVFEVDLQAPATKTAR